MGDALNRHDFEPSIGIGLVRISGTRVRALTAMNRAEQLALEAVASPTGLLDEDLRDPAQAVAVG